MKRWQHHLKASLQTRVAQQWIKQANREERAFSSAMQEYTMSEIPSVDWASIKWTDDVRMTKVQADAVENLIDSGIKVWAVVQHKITGASAVALKHGVTWMLVFEDGTTTSGRVPKFPKVWPLRLKRPDFRAQRKEVFKLDSLGGFTLSRYS